MKKIINSMHLQHHHHLLVNVFKVFSVVLICLSLQACAPTAVQVLALNEDGTYQEGDEIKVLVKLSKPILVTGNPQLELDVSGRTVIADYRSQWGINGILFTYTVASGDYTEDLSYPSTLSFKLNGATILDLLGAAAITTLPVPGALNSLSYSSNIKLDAFNSLAGAKINMNFLGSGGFGLKGEKAVDYFGNSATKLGDINGDGIDDIAIAAFLNDSAGADSGVVTVIYGAAERDFSAIDPAAPKPEEGFKIQRGDCCNNLGSSIASAGDVNGDGINDIIIGSRFDDVPFVDAGAAYIVYGRNSATGINVDVATMDTSIGITLTSSRIGVNYMGAGVAGIGDLNKDGFDDVAISAPLGDDFRADAGVVYVVYGRSSGGNIDVNTMSTASGFKILGEDIGDRLGLAGNALALAETFGTNALTSLGDINGDGIDDMAIGAWFAEEIGTGVESGVVYVVFGKLGLRSNLNVSVLRNNTTDGFVITGEAIASYLGSVSGIGDVNDDGLNDLLVGSPMADVASKIDAGKAHIIWGKSGSTRANIALNALTPANGLTIFGNAIGDYLGSGLGGLGDINGDGIDDIIVAAPHTDNLLASGILAVNAGTSYIIFGSATLADDIQVAELGEGGATLIGAAAVDHFGFSVSGAGDLNNDGLNDILSTAALNDEMGVDAGKAYVVFGKAN